MTCSRVTGIGVACLLRPARWNWTWARKIYPDREVQMATRKLPALALVMALLSLVAVPAGLACKRHARRVVHHRTCVVHHRVVHHYISRCRRHYRVYGGGSAEPYIASLATATPMAALDLNAPPPLAKPNIPEPAPPAAVPPLPQPGPLVPCCEPPPPCNPCDQCCNGEQDHHRRHIF